MSGDPDIFSVHLLLWFFLGELNRAMKKKRSENPVVGDIADILLDSVRLVSKQSIQVPVDYYYMSLHLLIFLWISVFWRCWDHISRDLCWMLS